MTHICPHCGAPSKAWGDAKPWLRALAEFDFDHGVLRSGGREIRFTPREAQIFGLLAKRLALGFHDQSADTIANQLGISRATLRVHIHHIYGKLSGSAHTIINHWHGRYTLRVNEMAPA